MSKDYQDGFKDGFKAGLEEGKKLIPPAAPPMTSPSFPPFFPPQSPLFGGKTKCSKCGMVWQGAMGYVCPNLDCPVQAKAYSGLKIGATGSVVQNINHSAGANGPAGPTMSIDEYGLCVESEK